MNNLYWKLQSINNTDMIEVGSEEFNIYREKFKKNFETRELMSEEETLIHYTYNAWRNPLFSKIYSLTLAFVDGETLRVKYLTGSEKDLLQTFLNEVKGEYFKEFQLTHADAEYMLPYLGTRLDMHGFRTSLHKDLIYKGLRPWNLSGCSVRDYYQGAGVYKHSLKEIAWVYGLQTNYIEPVDEFNFYKKGNFEALKDSAINEIQTLANVHRLMMGDDEFNFYKKGNFEALKDSAINEIQTLANVHRLMMGENAVSDLSVVEQKVEAVEEVKPTNFLAVLYESQAMTLEVRNGLEKQLKKKKLTKRDREVIREIIIGVYISSDFINNNQDSKATIEKKTKEVDEFLATI